MTARREAEEPTAAELWLTIPWEDYESHMDHESVGQLGFLREVFAEVLADHKPESVVVVGCATGNGFDRVDLGVTRRVIGIDVNPAYLRVARERYAGSIPGLDLRCTELSACEIEAGSIDLVHAALILEYVEPRETITRMTGWLRPGGTLAVVLQCPAASNVSHTEVESVRCLESSIHLVEPAVVDHLAEEAGLRLVRSRSTVLPAGKPFVVAEYAKPV